MNGYPPNTRRRDPYAHNDPMKQYKLQKENRLLSLYPKIRNIVGVLMALILVLNTTVTIINTDFSSCKPPERPHINTVNGGDGTTSQSDTQQPPPVNSAYGRIIPAEGNFAWLIDKYIVYERGAMSSDEVVLSFTGDCTLGTWQTSNKDTNYNAIYNASGSPTYSFDNVKSLFANDDYTFINLETTLTNSTDRFKEKTYNFKGDPGWAVNMLKASFIDGCNLANNHSYDFKQSGYDETVKVINDAGMDVGDALRPVTVNINGLEIVLLSGNYIWEKVQLSHEKYGGDLTSQIVSQIKQYKRQDNIVVVNAHWGLERQYSPNYEQWDPARAFVDAGADMVIGHHPHTVQSVELYNGKLIFYSLGNFAFGGKATTDEVNRMSLIVRPRFALRDGKAEVTGVLVVPCYTTSAEDISVNNYQPRPLFGEEAEKLARKTISFSEYVKYGVDSLEFPTQNFEQ